MGRQAANCSKPERTWRRRSQADGIHVAHDLFGGFLEGDVQSAFSGGAAGVGKMSGERGFAGAGGAGDQHGRAFVKACAFQHVVEICNAAGNALGGNLVIEAQRGTSGKNGKTFVIDEEGIFVGAVGRAAILDDAHAAGGDLFVYAMIEEDDAIGDVFFEAVAGKIAFAAFSGDHSGEAAIFEPAEQPADFSAQHAGVGEAGEDRFERVEDHALGADGVDRVLQANEESFEIVLAGFLNFARFDADVVDGDFLALDQVRQVEAEGLDVAASSRRRFPQK